MHQTTNDLLQELEETRRQLYEAQEAIEAIRTGQVDALVVQSGSAHQLYTLRSADHAYRVFIEKMTEGAITLNREGLILYANSQFAGMMRLSLSDVIGLPFENFIANADKAVYQSLFKNCWKEDCKGELAIESNGQSTVVQISLTPLQMDEDISLSIIITDLTQQKKVQKQLEDNNRQLEQLNKTLEASNHDLQQFASVASHDLQEPLRKIQIFSNLLKENSHDLTPDLKKYLEKIIVSSSRMKTLILDILNYSRLSADDHQLECVEMDDLLKELLEDFELLVEEKGAIITRSPLPCMEVNSGQIRQVFQNIISNALKFSKPGEAPAISISSKLISQFSFDSPEQTDGQFCLITIADNGIGFDEKYMSKIFTLFERLNSKDKYEGTGIGLAIAKKIIDKHNGMITATSKNGGGTQFKFILPIKQSI